MRRRLVGRLRHAAGHHRQRRTPRARRASPRRRSARCRRGPRRPRGRRCAHRRRGCRRIPRTGPAAARATRRTSAILPSARAAFSGNDERRESVRRRSRAGRRVRRPPGCTRGPAWRSPPARRPAATPSRIACRISRRASDFDRREDDQQGVDLRRREQRPRSSARTRPGRPTRSCRPDCGSSPWPADAASTWARVAAESSAQRQARRLAGIGRQNARAAGVRDDRDAASARAAAACRDTPRCRTSRRACRRE